MQDAVPAPAPPHFYCLNLLLFHSWLPHWWSGHTSPASFLHTQEWSQRTSQFSWVLLFSGLDLVGAESLREKSKIAVVEGRGNGFLSCSTSVEMGHQALHHVYDGDTGHVRPQDWFLEFWQWLLYSKHQSKGEFVPFIKTSRNCYNIFPCISSVNILSRDCTLLQGKLATSFTAF